MDTIELPQTVIWPRETPFCKFCGTLMLHPDCGDMNCDKCGFSCRVEGEFCWNFHPLLVFPIQTSEQILRLLSIRSWQPCDSYTQHAQACSDVACRLSRGAGSCEGRTRCCCGEWSCARHSVRGVSQVQGRYHGILYNAAPQC
jgi:hypothetical protein